MAPRNTLHSLQSAETQSNSKYQAAVSTPSNNIAPMQSHTEMSLCSSNHVPTSLPTSDMSAEWCVVPFSGNAPAIVLQDCCASGEVHNTDGCEWCYVQDSSAEDGLTFDEDFAECLRRQANVYNLTRPQTSYCNTPNYPSTSAALGMRIWGGWVSIALLGLADEVLADV